MKWLLAFVFFQNIFVFTFAVCPEGTVQSMSDNSTCFLFVSKRQSFLLAEEYCNQQNGHLTSIHNAFDNVLIREQAQQNFTDSTSDDFWVGLNDLKTSETWEWIDGSAFNFADWDKGQPQKLSNYDCGSVKLQGGNWITDDCDKQKSFVCTIKVTTINMTTTTKPPPKQCPNNWTYYDATGYCYYVGTNKAWENAEDYCYSQGAHLASIHSLTENIFITNLIPFNPNDHQCDAAQFAYIGLYTVNNQGTWRWTDNTPFNYSIWGPGEPAFANAYAYCGLIQNGPVCGAPTETWVSGICDISHGFFICKKLL